MIFNIKKKELRTIIPLIILIVNIVIFSGCIEKQQNNDYQEEEIIRIGIYLPPNNNITLPSITDFDNYSPQIKYPSANIYDSLVEFDEKYKIIPSLAESWHNPDNFTWRFILRNDIKFQNGYNFSAEDVKYTIEKMNNSRLLSIIEKIIIIDNYTIDIITSKVEPTFLNCLTQLYIISKKYHIDTENFPPVGTGPYMFHNYSNGNSITLKKYNKYWKDDFIFDYATFRFYDNYEEKIDAFNLGDVDLIDELNPADYDRFRQLNDTAVVNVSYPNVYYISFDFKEYNKYWNEEVNPVSNVSVRRAIYYAINITTIIEQTNNYTIVAPVSQLVNSNIVGCNPKIKRFEYNRSKALQCMKEAGYEHGFEIELDFFNTTPINIVSSLIADNLKEINISVKMDNLTYYELLQKILNHDSSFFIIGWQMESRDAMEIFNDVLSSVNISKGYGEANLGYYSNAKIDNITEKINNEINDKIRIPLMQEGFQIAYQDVAYIPIFELRSTYAFNNRISFTPRADTIIKLNSISINS